jgi:ubiquinone/menaquinone biosynthesis C-methylase UbiE
MTNTQEYVLGQSRSAADRLAIQDAHFAEISEALLDELAIRPNDRVVELGCGAGSMSLRILNRLGKEGVLVGVDITQGLLNQASSRVANVGEAQFEPVLADITQLGSWLDNADVVLGRTVLHHIPMVEILLGHLLSRLRTGTRIGFLEPDFRAPLGQIAYLESTGRMDLAPIRIWSTALNQLYLIRKISPATGASLGLCLEMAGYQEVKSTWCPGRCDEKMIENMRMVYDELAKPYESNGIMTLQEIEEQKRLLLTIPPETLPPAWGIYRVTAKT